MTDFLDVLARDVLDTIEGGYYEVAPKAGGKPQSLKQSIVRAAGNPVIAEIKPASPSTGFLKGNLDIVKFAGSLIRGGAAGLSVLTEPKHFKGSIGYVTEINEAYRVPVLMKDFIINEVQLKAARKIGASAVLLISTLYSRGYGETDLDDMISLAHGEKLEVLLETHSLDEFKEGMKTDADLLGINNRDLKTLNTDLRVTERILRSVDYAGKLVVSESGIRSGCDVKFLRGCGASVFLVGTAVMNSGNPESKVMELVKA